MNDKEKLVKELTQFIRQYDDCNIQPHVTLKVIEQYLEPFMDKNKKMKAVLEKYAYPPHEDGDRAYIFGHEAREVLKDIE